MTTVNKIALLDALIRQVKTDIKGPDAGYARIKLMKLSQAKRYLLNQLELETLQQNMFKAA